jgi:poly(3-hydroxybutyrate) depolymerase
MRVRRIAIAVAVIVVGVPVLLGLTAVVSFYALFYFPNRTTATAGTIVSSGLKREKSYDPARPTSLVISMHPAMSWPSSQMSISQWNGVADENEILVVYPAGTGSGPRTRLMWAFFRAHPRRPPPPPGERRR